MSNTQKNLNIIWQPPISRQTPQFCNFALPPPPFPCLANIFRPPPPPLISMNFEKVEPSLYGLNYGITIKLNFEF